MSRGIQVKGKYFACDCVEMELYSKQLGDGDVQEMLHALMQGTFTRLDKLNLVSGPVTVLLWQCVDLVFELCARDACGHGAGLQHAG